MSSFEEAERHLDRAWYAALVAATFDGVVGAMAILGTRAFTLAAVLYTSRVLLTLLLAYGVARRNRIAAILLLVLGILTVGIDFRSVGFVRFVLGVVFVYLYARGVQATFAYHRLLAAGPGPLGPARKASA
jgi:hypothetical protein